VGSAAQPKVIKSVAGSLRLELAQYRELAAFSQFSSDLDAETQARLSRGRLLTELLKQPQYSPFSVWQQAATIIAGTGGALDKVPIDKVKDAQNAFMANLEQHHQNLIKELEKDDTVSDQIKEKVVSVAKQIANQYEASGTEQ
jgi:F-type H+-transporting ATPase subunit alpha